MQRSNTLLAVDSGNGDGVQLVKIIYSKDTLFKIYMKKD